MAYKGKSDRHIRHCGVMIDASFNRDGSISHYVVEGGIGHFYSLEIAKEIAEHRSRTIPHLISRIK